MDASKILTFIYFDTFVVDWESLVGSDKDERGLWNLESTIMDNPTEGQVMVGTGGLRKMRFSKHDINLAEKAYPTEEKEKWLRSDQEQN